MVLVFRIHSTSFIWFDFSWITPKSFNIFLIYNFVILSDKNYISETDTSCIHDPNPQSFFFSLFPPSPFLSSSLHSQRSSRRDHGHPLRGQPSYAITWEFIEYFHGYTSIWGNNAPTYCSIWVINFYF